MRFDTKLAIVLLNDLAVWQKLNATAFLTSGIAATRDLVGAPYEDADGVTYLPMFRQPVLVFEADGEGLRRAFERALTRDVAMTVFTRELFTTGHDEANRAAVAAVGTAELDLVGIGLFGPKTPVGKCLKGLELHG